MPATEPATISTSSNGGNSGGDDSLFVFEYAINVDDQWRVTIPSAWRQNLPERSQLFMQLRGDFLVVMPLAEMNRFRARANTEVPPEDRGGYLRALGRATEQTFIDSAGRITLPSKWAEKVGIAKKTKVKLVGAVEKFEIWAADKLEADPDDSIKRGEMLMKKFT